MRILFNLLAAASIVAFAADSMYSLNITGPGN